MRFIPVAAEPLRRVPTCLSLPCDGLRGLPGGRFWRPGPHAVPPRSCWVGLGDDGPRARRQAVLLMPPASFAVACATDATWQLCCGPSWGEHHSVGVWLPGHGAQAGDLSGKGSDGPGVSQTLPVAKGGGEVSRASACANVICDTLLLCRQWLFTQLSPMFHRPSICSSCLTATCPASCACFPPAR